MGVVTEMVVSQETPLIGYEYLTQTGQVTDESNAVFLHAWNPQDDYYFNMSSGIQFSNHFDEFWAKNIFCFGFKAGGVWTYNCVDTLPFAWTVSSDNLTYVNYTGFRDIVVGTKEVKATFTYHLPLDSDNISIDFSIKNIGGSDINLDLGFAWRMKDIKIGNEQQDDWIEVNNTNYELNQPINRAFKDVNGYFLLEDSTPPTAGFLSLAWNDNLKYVLNVTSIPSQFNAPVTLAVNAGTLAQGQTKKTRMYWRDPPKTTWTYTIFLYEIFANNDTTDDVQIFNSTITVNEGSSGSQFNSGLSLGNLTMNHTYWFWIKAKGTEASYNYAAIGFEETGMYSLVFTDSISTVPWNDNGTVSSDGRTQGQYDILGNGSPSVAPGRLPNLVPDDTAAQENGLDAFFWTTDFDLSITETIADNINYTHDNFTYEEGTVRNANFVGGSTFLSYTGTELTSGQKDTNEEGTDGYTDWASRPMDNVEFYYWGILFTLDDDFTDQEHDVMEFLHGGEAGDSDQTINWNWTIVANVSTGGGGDTCTYSGSGDFIIDSGDSCNTDYTNIMGNDVVITGSGTTTLNVTNYSTIKITTSRVICNTCTM